jgi:rhodanese-related sulfurtransferase
MDVLAVALRAGLTVFDLEDLELSYAPPYGSAKDPVNMVGFVASNVLRGDAATWELEELATPSEALLLDVRMPVEFAQGTIPSAVNLSVDDLRERLAELPKDRELRVFCQVGLRGYVACRMLSQLGYRCRNLSGGYRIYSLWKGAGLDGK